jgi:hypothetical protein
VSRLVALSVSGGAGSVLPGGAVEVGFRVGLRVARGQLLRSAGEGTAKARNKTIVLGTRSRKRTAGDSFLPTAQVTIFSIVRRLFAFFTLDIYLRSFLKACYQGGPCPLHARPAIR